jgi:signal transduction histidine kinase
MDCKSIDLKQVIEEVCKHGEIIADEKNIKIITAFLEPVQINGDMVRLRQMTSNLLHNAIKYTQPGGQIKISLEDQKDSAFMTVQDTGIGIPEEHLPLIFNRFHRVDKSRSKEDGGSGLGLSICKHIIEAHQGKIEVESQPGVGTKFKIYFPKIPCIDSEKV